MNAFKIREALRNGTPVFGTLITSPSPFWPPHVKSLNLDWVFIDTEHIPLGRSEVAWMCQAYGALDMAPIVRIASPDAHLAQQALDGGAAGIIVPYVESVEQVQALAGVVSWGPLKGGKLNKIIEGEPASDVLKSYMEPRNSSTVFIVQVESLPALASLDEIVSVPRLDAILIGPHDLSISLDVPEDYAQPRFQETVHHIIKTARKAGIGVGVHFADIEQETAWIRAGANLISHGSDINTFLRGMAADLQQLQGIDAPDSPKNIDI